MTVDNCGRDILRASSKMLDFIRRRCLCSGLEFDLDRDWILQRLSTGKCDVTGLQYSYEKHGKAKPNRLVPSVDRIDSQVGYTKSNCRIVVFQFNVLKGSWSDEDALELAIAMVRRNTGS